MKEFNYVIKDSAGIHARPAGLLAKKAAACGADVTIVKDGKEAAAKKLLAIMSLCVKCGDEITVKVNGGDEEAVCADMKAFFEENL